MWSGQRLLKAVAEARRDVKVFILLAKKSKKFCNIGKKMYLCNPNSKGTHKRPKNDLGLIR